MTVTITLRQQIADGDRAAQHNTETAAVSNELAATILSIASSYRAAQRPLPDHLIADLMDVAKADTIAHRLRVDASRLLERQW